MCANNNYVKGIKIVTLLEAGLNTVISILVVRKGEFYMFKLFKDKNMIYSPVNGKCISLNDVGDGVFSNKILGDGVAFRFDGEFVNSPCFGKVIMITTTKHAVGIQMNNGAEILIHVGLDTVELGGKGLQVLVKNGEIVRPGDQLVKIKRKVMEENNIDLTTMLIVTNTPEYDFNPIAKDAVKNKEELFSINKKGWKQ